MKALVNTEYGPPSVVRLSAVERPTPKDNEVLVKVFATTVNRTDCGFRKAEPFFVRIFSGLVRPKRTILGREFAGEVESVGNAVTTFKAGDQVFGLSGDGFGAHAQYVCVPEIGAIAGKPANMTYDEAASVCDGAVLALSCLRAAGIAKGQRVMIYGASGSIGSAAVQIAKYLGADVTAVCGTRNLGLAKSLGADDVIDYTKEDFTKSSGAYDVVFDAVGKSSFSRCKGLLKQSGKYVVPDLGFLYQNGLLALWTSKIGSKKVLFPLPKERKEDIALFKSLIEAGHLKAVIDRRYPMEHIVEAYRYVETGHKTGNVVITVEHQA